jgi:hypothetical protein
LKKNCIKKLLKRWWVGKLVLRVIKQEKTSERKVGKARTQVDKKRQAKR